MKKFVLYVLLFLWAVTVVAQDTGGDKDKDKGSGGGGSSADANANSGASATINNSSSSGRQFIGALPGPVSNPGPFPGFAAESGRWQLYYPAIGNIFSMEQIETMKKHGGKVHSVVISKGGIPSNNNDVRLIPWWPKIVSHENDLILATVTVTGKYLEPEEGALGTGLAECKKLAHSSRVAVRVSAVKEGVTHGRSFGTGGAASGIARPTEDNAAIAIAAGGVLGTNRVRMEEYPQFEFLCMNDGPFEAPKMPERQRDPVPPPPPPSAPPQEVRVKIEVVQAQPTAPLLQAPALAQPPAREAAPMQTATTLDECNVPALTVLFDLDRFDVKSHYLAKFQELKAWIAKHPSCRLQVEGHTCTIGSERYNAMLGYERAKAVYEALIGIGVSKDQLIQFVTPGKSKPASEYRPGNRRVIVRAIGVASGK